MGRAQHPPGVRPNRPKVLRAVLDGLTIRLDGKPGSPVVVTRRRKIFTGMLEYGAEINALSEFGLRPRRSAVVGERNKEELPILTINRIWRQARQAAFIPEVYASPLAETPYDLRHAFVSTNLNAGISPAQVAEWAGQSPEVMWRIYAGCLDGGREELRRRMEAGFGGRAAVPIFGTSSVQITVESR